MFSLDDRTGNIVTTAALFAVGALILYMARGAFFILLLSLFFAYLLEPAVALVQRCSLLGVEIARGRSRRFTWSAYLWLAT